MHLFGFITKKFIAMFTGATWIQSTLSLSLRSTLLILLITVVVLSCRSVPPFQGHLLPPSTLPRGYTAYRQTIIFLVTAMRTWNLALSPLSINQSASRSCSSVLSFRYFDQTFLQNSYISHLFYTIDVDELQKKFAYCVSTRIFSVRIRSVICFSHWFTHSLTCTMTLSRADLELWAVRALSLHHAAPMVTVCALHLASRAWWLAPTWSRC